MSPRQDMAFGVQAGLRSPTSSRDGSSAARADLDAQLRRLRSLEDPANAGATAVTYREMVAGADDRIMAGGSYAGGIIGVGADGGEVKHRRGAES